MRIRTFLPVFSLAAFLGAAGAFAQYPAQYPAQAPYPEQQPVPDYPQQYPPQYPPQYPQAQQQPGLQQEPEPQDQPGAPVARLSLMSGDVSVRRGDSGDWVAAAMNAPLMAGDAISVGPGGRAEVQFDIGNFVRIGGDSEIRLSDLGNGRYQVQLARGMVTWRVLRDGGGQAEISTPLVAVDPERDTAVRVEVAPDTSTRVIVRRGAAVVSNARGTQQVRDGSMMLVRGDPANPEFQIVYAAPRDGWDSWNDERDAYLLRAQSPQYVSQDVYGTEDLDQYGRWVQDPSYGAVWAPNVPVGWSPYSNGQWTWEDYYGWTWVDYDPWGWAPFHYGSWFYRGGPYGWAWCPGPRLHRDWWHPAMVGFFGFGGAGWNVGFGFGNIGWVPLAPYERFHPWYGPGWFGRGRSVFVNYSTVNIFNTYRNARFAGGVRAVSAVDFQRGNFRNAVAVNRGILSRASLVRGALPLTPSVNNLRFSGRQAVVNGPRTNFGNQRFFSRMRGAAAGAQVRTPFAQQQAAIRSSFTRESGFRAAGRTASGWQRFGEPNRNPQGFSPRANSSEGWSRFGSPQMGGGLRQAPGSESRSFGAARGEPNFRSAPQQQYGGERSGPAIQGRPSGPAFQGERESPAFRGGPAPAWRGGSAASGFGGGAYRGFNAPRAEPSVRNAPRQQYRGGGSAPTFRSAPAFRGGGERPAFRGGSPSFRGGNTPAFRGGGGGGGGSRGGGGGHGRR